MGLTSKGGELSKSKISDFEGMGVGLGGQNFMILLLQLS